MPRIEGRIKPGFILSLVAGGYFHMSLSGSENVNLNQGYWPISISHVSTGEAKSAERSKLQDTIPPETSTDDIAQLSSSATSGKITPPSGKEVRENESSKTPAEALPEPSLKTSPDPVARAIELHNREGSPEGKLSLTSTGALMMEELPEAPCEDSSISITILHTNDMHGFMTGKEGNGSFSEIAEKAKEINRENENVLYLDAGDSTEGTHTTNDAGGRPMIEAIDTLNDELKAQDRESGRGGDSDKVISTVGNHEAMYGAETMRENIENSRHPVVVSNLRDRDGNPLKNTKPYQMVIFRDKSGREVKAAIVGVTTRETGKEGIVVSDPVEAVKENSQRARAEGADLVIVLSHCGIEMDKEIAEKCPGIDVIVGGHSHDKTFEPVKVGDALIVQAGDNAQNLGQLDLKVDVKRGKVVVADARHKLIKVDNSMPKDENIEAISRKYEVAGKEEEYNRVIGHLDETLYPPREDSGVETKMGNAFADRIRKEGNADIAVFNKGALRAKLDKGDVTQRASDNAFHYKDKIVTVRMKGSEVSDLIEKSFADRPHGGVYCTSGMKIEYDPMAPKGEKVRKIEIERTGPDGKTYLEALDPGREYSLATLSFIADKRGLKGEAHGSAKDSFDAMMKEAQTNKDLFKVSTDRIKDLSEERADANEKVGKTLFPLITPKDREESGLGNFMVDAVRKMAAASMGLLNRNGVREGIEAGDITRRSLFFAFPFDDHVISADFKGSEVLSIVEKGIQKEQGALFALSGLKLKYDSTAPEGSRVKELTMNGEPLDPERTYRLGFTDYMRDNFEGMTRGRNVIDHGMFRELLVGHVKQSIDDPAAMKVATGRIEDLAKREAVA